MKKPEPPKARTVTKGAKFKISDFVLILLLLFVTFVLMAIVVITSSQKEASAIPLMYPSETSYRIKFTLDLNGVPISGESANTKVGIMEGSTHQWFDFADKTFKESGWTESYSLAAESTINSDFPYYYIDWVLPSTETSEETYTLAVRTTGNHKIYKMIDISYYQIKFKAR